MASSVLKASNKLNIDRSQGGIEEMKEDVKKVSVMGDNAEFGDENVKAEKMALSPVKLASSEPSPPFGEDHENLSDCSEDEDEYPKTWSEIYAFYENEMEDDDCFPLAFSFSQTRNCYEVNSRNIFYLKSFFHQMLANKEEFGESFVIEEDLVKPTLSELLEYIGKNPNMKKVLPTRRFDFHSGPLTSPDLDDFIGKYAQEIKHMALCYDCRCVHAGVKVRCIDYLSFLQHFTAAEELELNFPKHWDGIDSEEVSELEIDKLINLPLILPKLKTVAVGDNLKLTKINEAVFLKVLSSAENVQEVENVFPALAEVLAKNGKMHLIKSMDISPSEDESSSRYLASYQQVAELEPKLTSLNIGYDALRFQPIENEKSISKILLSSKDTLEELWIHPLARLKRLKMPVLTKLKKLHMSSLPTDKDKDFHCAYAVHDVCHGLESLHLLTLKVRGWVERDYVMFPRGVNVANAFPNLHSVTLDLVTEDTNFARLYFPSRPCIPSVKELSVSGICTSTWIKKLSLMFPKVTQLDLGFDASDTESARDLWQGWPLLESLYFRFIDWDDVSYPALDSIFTGIPEKCCEKLRKVKGIPATGRATGVEKLRKKSSILSLKNLKQLKMRLMNQDKFEDDSFDCCSSERPFPALEFKTQEYKLISPVSLHYAFMKIPELRVVVEYNKELSSDLAKDLNSLWPHVIFDECA